MADSSTNHLNLIKQDPNSDPDITKDHSNLDTLDSEIWARGKTFNGEPVGIDGGFHVSRVPYSDNLWSEMTQSSEGSFIIRTSGGTSSISSGGAWLMKIVGDRVHTGHADRVVSMTVTPMEREDPIEATIDNDTFIAQMSSSSGTFTFTYQQAWSADPATYGITVTGTPVAGDVISVTYAKEVRGTITHSNPQTLVSTGWNLYNHTNGYAKIIKYSDTYAFKIDGTYTGLSFAYNLTDEPDEITPVLGGFNPFDNDDPIGTVGYVFVEGGNNTNTQIWMTWEDWGVQANGGTFAAYSETVVDFSDFMTLKFPYGLMRVGTVRDEINFNIGLATSYIERQTYNSENIAAAKASGRQYEYDENYIYIERSEPVTYSTSTYGELPGSYTANDHGIEEFTGTSVEVYAETIYGANLKNKLERDVVTKSSDVVDNLTSTATDKALSAKQGKVLDEKIDDLASNTVTKSSGIANNLTSTATDKALSANMGKYLDSEIGAVCSYERLYNGSLISETKDITLLYSMDRHVNLVFAIGSGTNSFVNIQYVPRYLFSSTSSSVFLQGGGTNWGSAGLRLNYVNDTTINVEKVGSSSFFLTILGSKKRNV